MKKQKRKQFTITAAVVLNVPTVVEPDDISIDLDISGNYTIDEPTITPFPNPPQRESFLMFYQDATRLNAKTDRFYVREKTQSLSDLGLIAWFGRWRRYAFFPAAHCVFDVDCMREIADYIEALMEKRKALKALKDE